MVDEEFYSQYSHGSSRFGCENDARKLSAGRGLIGIYNNEYIRFQPEQPSIIFGGAGSGKFANLGAYQLVHPSTQSFFILDVGGQYMSTTWHYNLALGRKAYAINVQGISAYPNINHPINLWGILKNDETLFENCRHVAALTLSESDMIGDNAWVGQGARRWITRMLTSLVRLDHSVTPKSLIKFIHKIDTNSDYLKSWGVSCHGLPNDEYSTFLEIFNKQHTSEKEYGAIMGKIKTDLDWLSSPEIADSISGEKDYLSLLGEPNEKVGIYYALKGGTSKEMESLTRIVVGIAQRHCVNANKGAHPLFYLEEAATCGKASFIKKAVSEYRKYFHTVLVYQSHGQLVHLFDKAGAQEIMDSCGMQIYLGGGIREIESAKRLADSVGKTTIYIDNRMAQSDHAYKAQRALWDSLLHDGDVFDAVGAYEHGMRQSSQQSQAGRHVIDPAELMRLQHEILVLSPGMGIRPILAQKLPNYWENPLMAGRYAPDPLFPPLDRVTIQGRWRKKTKRYMRQAVPEHFKDWPNHINGEVAYVKGYRTF